MSTHRFGDRVRVSCGATGRALGVDDLALFVSCMDNDTCIDTIRTDGDPPHPTLPVPTDDELSACAQGIVFGRRPS
jgi:hypothetical protein